MRVSLPVLTLLCACHIEVPKFTAGGDDAQPPDNCVESADYGGGDGTIADPFRLCTADHLTALTTRPQDLGAAFIVARDIDFADGAFPGIGSLATPFTGQFDGGGHTIANLRITGGAEAGLFNAISRARLDHVHVDHVTVQGGTSVGVVVGTCLQSELRDTTVTMSTAGGMSDVGGLFGDASECDTLQATLGVTVTGSGNGVGGIVGESEHSTYLNIDATVDVVAPLASGVGGAVGEDEWDPTILQNVHIMGDVVGNESVGGLVGENDEGVLLYRSRFEGTVSGNIGVGGFAGGNYDSPFNVYATSVIATVSGNSGVGGFSGTHGYRTSYHDSYFKGTLTGTGPLGTQSAFGGFYGDVEDPGFIERSYTDVTINSQGTGVGGFIGRNVAWSSNSALYDIAHSFAAPTVTGLSTTATVSFWVGDKVDPNPLVGAGSYYWSGGTCTNQGGGGCNPGGSAIADVTQFQTPGSSQLSTWDFTNVWQATAGQFPTHRLDQKFAPAATKACGTIAISGLRYTCGPEPGDADINEARVILLDHEHTCAWLRPDYTAIPTPYSPELDGVPTISDAGTCTIAYSLSDGPHTVASAPLALDVHLGVVLSPLSSPGYASYGFGTHAVSSSTTVAFTLTNRESNPATISLTGLAAPFSFAGTGTYPGTGGNCGQTIAVNGQCTVAITFTPTATGSASKSFTVQFSAGRGPVSYPFLLTGTGN